MQDDAARIDQSLLNDWQRGFPIVEQPFDVIAGALGIAPDEVTARLEDAQHSGRVTRVGATCAPNTISASTLAAVAAPQDRIEDVAEIIGAEPGVNHSYLREHDWNLWFVATGPDRAHVDKALARISARSGLRVLDLPLVRPFNVDLGFSMTDATAVRHLTRPADLSVFGEGDRPIIEALMRGLPLVRRPYAAVADRLDLSEAHVLERIHALTEAGIIARLGVIVRHRALGWRSNAMVVWDMPSEAITHAGPLLARQPGVSLCYERRPVEDVWPYRLYSMIHARSHREALDYLDNICRLPEFRDVAHLPLFSIRCFKQTGATVGRSAPAILRATA